MIQNTEKPTVESIPTPSSNEDRESDAAQAETFELANLAGSGSLDRLVDTARDYARQAAADNTNAAYKADWAHFSAGA